MRALHRKVSKETQPFKMLVPYHSFKRKDGAALVPGEMAEPDFGLLPTSVLIRRNHRIRIAIAGHDKDTFARIPASGVPDITVSRNKHHASFIEKPVIPRPQSQTGAPAEPVNKAKDETAATVRPA